MKRRSCLLLLGIVMSCALVRVSSAQLAPAERVNPPLIYTPEVSDMDWTYLGDPATGVDWTDRIHFVELGSPARYLSVTGQIRERGEY